MQVGIYIYDQAEVLDFSGPYEVFSTATRMCQGAEPFEVCLIGETGAMVTARAGYQVAPHYGFHNHPPLDVLIIAGGVHTEEMTKKAVLAWVENQSSRVSVLASVCTGAFILAQCGLLEGCDVTTHWEDIPELEKFPRLNVKKNVRWVDEGKLITSGGISAGIDMSLHMVSKLHSLDLAEKTAKQMEFAWTKNSPQAATPEDNQCRT